MNNPTSAFETGKPDSFEIILPTRFEVGICDKKIVSFFKENEFDSSFVIFFVSKPFLLTIIFILPVSGVPVLKRPKPSDRISLFINPSMEILAPFTGVFVTESSTIPSKRAALV